MALTPTLYIYQRRGQNLYNWSGGPPPQQRGADAKSLGSLGDEDTFGIQRPLLPRPGAPEFLDDPIDTLGAWDAIPSSSPPIRQYGLGGVGGKKKKCGCGCKGKKKCGPKRKAVGEYVGTGEYVNAMGEYVGMGDAAPVPTTIAPVVVVNAQGVPIDDQGRPLLDPNGMPITYPMSAQDTFLNYAAEPGAFVLGIIGNNNATRTQKVAVTAGIAYLLYRHFKK